MKTLRITQCLLMIMFLAPLHAGEALKPRVVIVFGDSITAGNGIPREKQWLSIMERDAKGAIKGINEGKGGRPTSARAEFSRMLLAHKQADMLVIALGMNDSRDLTDTCVPKAVANVRFMIENARQAYGPALCILVVGPSNINKNALGPTKPIAREREARLKELGEAFSVLGREMKCEYVSLFGVVPERALSRDGVHPDAEGNAAIAEFLLPRVLKFLE